MAASQTFADYLNALASTEPGMVTDAGRCPIVTFFDPMSVADADRVIVMCPNASTDTSDKGRFEATLDIGIKTLWKQATVKTDFAKHFSRVKDIRDKLMPEIGTLLGLVTPFVPAGMSVDFIEHRIQFKSHIAESTTAKWIYSGTFIELKGFFTQEG